MLRPHRISVLLIVCSLVWTSCWECDDCGFDTSSYAVENTSRSPVELHFYGEFFVDTALRQTIDTIEIAPGDVALLWAFTPPGFTGPLSTRPVGAEDGIAYLSIYDSVSISSKIDSSTYFNFDCPNLLNPLCATTYELISQNKTRGDRHYNFRFRY